MARSCSCQQCGRFTDQEAAFHLGCTTPMTFCSLECHAEWRRGEEAHNNFAPDPTSVAYVNQALMEFVRDAQPEPLSDGDKAMIFFNDIQTDDWLFQTTSKGPLAPAVRVFEFEKTDTNRHAMVAQLLLPTRQDADHAMDYVSNLMALGQLGRSVRDSMLPLPEGVGAIAWQAILVPDAEQPTKFLNLRVVAMHRRATTDNDVEIASLNRRLEELKKK